MNENTPNDLLESWKVARAYAGRLGNVPSSFITTIRTLCIDEREGLPSLSAGSRFLMSRFLRGPTMKAIFYYATLTFHGEEVANTPFLSSSQLLSYFSPGELASMIAVVYIHRQLKQQVKSDDWEAICANLLPEYEIGVLTGMAIPAIGPKVGGLAACMKFFAQGMYLLHSPKEFKNYRLHLQSHKLQSDEEYESSVWGCTSRQIAASLIQTMGLGVDLANSFYLGCAPECENEGSLERDTYRFFIAREWIDSLRAVGQAPAREHRGEFYPMQRELHRLLYRVDQVRESGGEYRWLERGRDDISIGRTPQLYQESLIESSNPEMLERFCQENLPSEVLEGLTADEIRELSRVDQTPEEDD